MVTDVTMDGGLLGYDRSPSDDQWVSGSSATKAAQVAALNKSLVCRGLIKTDVHGR
jgi:hypothetical protein